MSLFILHAIIKRGEGNPATLPIRLVFKNNKIFFIKYRYDNKGWQTTMYNPIINKSRHYGNNRWFAFSPKLRRVVYLYSDLEYDNWVLTEMNPDVKTFCEQPLRICKNIDGQLITSIPDMWIRWNNKKETLVEVKYSSQLNWDHPKSDRRTFLQIQCQTQWCQENGYDYQIHTERDVRSNPIFLENMKRLLPYLRHYSETIDTDDKRLLRAIGRV